ncbi:hypothetical protein PFLG_00513 [Plasmodium falciparum RAJ116]|uniref:Uncharacterized protein n=1 Tax=Plasmodium falciparum RAJ116 TaxID=580058 RepID=A0A0L0CW92_PLAFA|nr:hypothetical protein PFLG_00513 [Plasmodium falciparum RAJ116]
MNFRKPDKTADLIDSIINSENGKVQKYVLERKRKEKEFLEKKENIKKKIYDGSKIKSNVCLRTVHEYKKIKDEIYRNKKDNGFRERTQDDKHTKQKNFHCLFCPKMTIVILIKNESDDK